MCSDMQDYVCKYAAAGDTMKLFCEFIAASFLKIWQLAVPEFALIQLNYDHVKQLNIPGHYIEKTCFGSQYSRRYQELNQFTDNPDVMKQKGYFHNRENFLKIALFDLWIGNEDRNFNNMNLLLDVENFDFVPIDHSGIFNSREVKHSLVLLAENESLASTELLKLLYPKFVFTKDSIQNLRDYFYLCTGECKEKFDEILKSVPGDWKIDLAAIGHKIYDELFSREWEDEVIKTFLDYIRSPFKI